MLSASSLVEHVQVTNVGGPILVVPVGSERHRFLLAAAALGFLVAVDLADLREYSAAGGAGEVEALPLEGGVDPERSEFGISGQLPHLLDGPEIHLPHPGGPAARPLPEALGALLPETAEDPVDGHTVDAEVAGYGL